MLLAPQPGAITYLKSDRMERIFFAIHYNLLWIACYLAWKLREVPQNTARRLLMLLFIYKVDEVLCRSW